MNYDDLQRWQDWTLEEFKDEINIGMDINLFIGDALFWLGAWDKHTRIISQCPNGQTEGVYKDADAMLDGFVFQGKTLREHFPDIVFTRC